MNERIMESKNYTTMEELITTIEELTQEQINAILFNLQQVLNYSEGRQKVALAILLKKLTIEKLQETGQLTPSLREQLQKEILAQKKLLADFLWHKAMQTQDLADFNKYIELGNDTENYNLAQTFIAGKISQQNQLSQKGEILEALRKNINAYRAGRLVELGITKNDLINGGLNLPQAILDIYESKCIPLGLGEAPEQVIGDNTEVYFWGITGSGKTCTLAAILKSATIVENSGMVGDGLNYFQRLANIFNNGVGTLPPGTEKEKYQTYTFDLVDDKSQTHYPMTFIDLPGELFVDFTKARYDSNYINTKESLRNFLTLIQDDRNPKYHFFIIDVCNNEIDAETGLTQAQLLSNAASFFTNYSVFNDQTAGIAILVTKSDTLSKDDNECYNKAKAILQTNDYKSFIATLKTIATDKHLISNVSDTLDLIPFSIGEVYLQTKCIFNDKKSQEVIRYLIEHIAHKKTQSRWSIFNL